MAAKTKAKPKKSKEIRTQRVRYVGGIEEIYGVYFHVPADEANPGQWIENEHKRAERKRLEAEAESQRQALEAEQKVKADAEAAAALEESVQVDLPVESEPAPETADEKLALAISLNNVTSNLLADSREVEKLQAELAAVKQDVQSLIVELKAERESKEEILKMFRNWREITNSQIAETSQLVNYTQSAVRNLNDEASAYRVIVQEGARDAREIKEIKTGIWDVLNSKFSEFVASFVEPMLFAFMSNVLAVIGVDRGQALQAMNNLEIGQKPILTRSEFKHLMGLYSRVNDVVVDADVRTTKAASEMGPSV